MARIPLTALLQSCGVSEGSMCELALNSKKLNFEDATSLISDIIYLHQLAQAHPHNVLHFLVHFLCIQRTGGTT